MFEPEATSPATNVIRMPLRTALPDIVVSLEGQARSIDLTFASAGGSLGEGLTLFDGLKARLSTLSGQMSGEAFAEAVATLRRLAEGLRPLRQILSTELKALVEIASHSADAGRTLDQLLKHVRLITILTRSARIEASSIQGAGSDFSDFANEISDLTTAAQSAIESCAWDHARMSKLLGAALTSQRDFEKLYGPGLGALTDELLATFAELEGRQQCSVDLARDAAAKSSNVGMSAGMAIISLQAGDSVRQRLEHAIAGLRLAISVKSETAIPSEAQEVARDLLCELEAAQLNATASTLAEDTSTIDRNLQVVQDETGGLVELVLALYGDASVQTGSFMTELGDDLAHASDLLAKCNAARADLDHVSEALTDLLDTCQHTVDALATTVSSIVLIGTNASLRAARVGSSGRSLIVIAQELKTAADLVARDARSLPQSFARMQQAAAHFKGAGRLGAGRFETFDRNMAEALSVINEIAALQAVELDQVSREAAAFAGAVEKARLAFGDVRVTAALIAAAGTDVANQQLAASSSTEMSSVAIDWVNGMVWSRYTMAAEREIHERVMLLASTGQVTPTVMPH
ncbi:MAG: hypothetical protein LCH80_05445 [Proteobacteria bacterium]|nr:hypothetical protein [Pseudomonadota bacterium]